MIGRRVNGRVEETQQQKQQKADELVQLLMGVALIAFAIVVVAFLLAARVADVLSRPY